MAKDLGRKPSIKKLSIAKRRTTLSKQNLTSNTVGEYMYVEMAHYTDDDTIVLICVANSNNFEVHEYKLEKLKDKNWSFLVQRFCSGNSSD